MEEDREEILRWEDFWSELRKPQDRIYLKHAHNWGNQKKWEGHTPEYEMVYHPCVSPWSSMHVTAMGIVPLCPADYDATMNMGDVNTQTIAEVWKNEKWTRVRQLHRTGQRNKLSMCQGCKIWDLDFSLENWQQKHLYDD
jgi:radical SAM protein with 4Fe4S-binding SPASM domain